MKILTEIFFVPIKEERRTRGHGVTLAKKQCRLDIRTFSFSQRIVNEWNRLSADCVGASHHHHHAVGRKATKTASIT